VTTSEVPLDQQSRQTMGSKENVNEVSKCTSKRQSVFVYGWGYGSVKKLP